jgi:hypothetical protein
MQIASFSPVIRCKNLTGSDLVFDFISLRLNRASPIAPARDLSQQPAPP